MLMQTQIKVFTSKHITAVLLSFTCRRYNNVVVTDNASAASANDSEIWVDAQCRNVL